jgi:hypothetical protein
MQLTSNQEIVINQQIASKIFLQGSAGSGKTTAGVHWLRKLLQAGIPAHEILIFVPQRSLAEPYLESLHESPDVADSLVDVVTLGGLARRMVDLYWPVISIQAGFKHPFQPPHFLTLETAQYYMAHIVRPLIEEHGYFNSLTINRNRIYSQILDNLNKAAIVGFPHQQIGEKLKSAWVGETEQFHIYDDVQSCANLFRGYCLESNLLDFSLQVEIFTKYLWQSPQCHEYLIQNYRHLIADNIEEDTPVSHDILRQWIPEFESALLIFDEDAGYRFFLGADTKTALSLRSSCNQVIQFEENLVTNSGISHLKIGIKKAVARLGGEPINLPEPSKEEILSALQTPEEPPKYFPAMIAWVADQVESLVKDGTPPGEIVILAPFMPDVLRFALSNQLNQHGIPNTSHRPSRPLRDEPATQTMLTLAAITYRSWNMLPKRINLALALMKAIDGLDLVRSQLLTAYVYLPDSEDPRLKRFEMVPASVRERITYAVGERYENLREWLNSYEQEESLPLDFFMNRLFGEVLSQPGYGFNKDMNSGNTIANLIESIQKFRWAVGVSAVVEPTSLGKEYLQMVQDGVIAAQYAYDLKERDQNAVFLAPAYTFLIKNQPVDIQFWLDIGSSSWYQRLDQPLTHPYVLSRGWKQGDIWTAENEIYAANQTLQRLSIGLLSRCRKSLYLGMSELDVRGYENRGLLVRIFQSALQNAVKRGK